MFGEIREKERTEMEIKKTKAQIKGSAKKKKKDRRG